MAHDDALLQLLEAWLALDTTAVPTHAPTDAPTDAPRKRLPPPMQSDAKRPKPNDSKPPLRDILYLHQAIRSALEAFVHDAQQLLHTGSVSPPQLSSLVEKHRFLRAICTCHSASEEEAVFPAARQLQRSPSDAGSRTGPDALPGMCDECEEDHAEEASLFEDLGRLLGDVKASTRRGAKDAATLTQRLCRSALAVRDAVGDHLRKEEANVFPVLESRLGPDEQRALVWHAMRAMPLRLIERVVPAMAGVFVRSMEGLVPVHAVTVLSCLRFAERGGGQRAGQQLSPGSAARGSRPRGAAEPVDQPRRRGQARRALVVVAAPQPGRHRDGDCERGHAPPDVPLAGVAPHRPHLPVSQGPASRHALSGGRRAAAGRRRAGGGCMDV